MKEIFLKLTKYFLTGGIAAIVDLTGFSFLLFLGVKLFFSAIISFCIAAVINFLLTSRFVFQKKSTFKMFVLFLCFALVGLLINVGVTLISVNYFDTTPIYSKLIGIGTAFIINFFLNLCVVYKVKKVSY